MRLEEFTSQMSVDERLKILEQNQVKLKNKGKQKDFIIISISYKYHSNIYVILSRNFV